MPENSGKKLVSGNIICVLLVVAAEVPEVKSAKKAEHELFEETDVSVATCENVVLGNAVHSAGNEVNDEHSFFVGNVTYEVFAVHQRVVLHVIEKVYHIVSDQKAYDVALFYDIAAEAFAEASEHG